MSLLVGLGESLVRDVRINLGRAQRCMPEEFLNATQISTTIEKVGRCCVAECVRA